MDMLRKPTIMVLPDNPNTETPALRLICLMETNGADPWERDQRARQGYEYRNDGTPEPGTTFREDVAIPFQFRNNAEYIANEMTRAWARIWKKTVSRQGHPEGTDFKATNVKLEPDDFTPSKTLYDGELSGIGFTAQPMTEPAEGALLDVIDAEIKPHYTLSVDRALDTRNLYMRPGRVIPVHGNPVVTPATLEQAYERGLISTWEYRWLKLRRAALSLFRGRSKPSANSGARSAPRTPGTSRTGQA